MIHTRTLVQLLLAGLLLAPPVLAQDQHHHAAPAEVSFSAVDYAFEGPDQLEAGLVEMTFTNNGQEEHHLQFARLNDGVTFEQFVAALQEGEAAALALIDLSGGVASLSPGQRGIVTVNLEKPGTYVALCFIPNAEGVPHLALGMIKPIEVLAPANAATDAPQADLVVHMRDFGYDIPAQVNVGEQIWEVVNDGPQPHELALVKLNEGKTVADVMAYLQAGGLGLDTPYDAVGGAQAMSLGRSSFVHFDLTPGEYLALCYVPDPATGQPHLALGMLGHFVVSEASAQQ